MQRQQARMPLVPPPAKRHRYKKFESQVTARRPQLLRGFYFICCSPTIQTVKLFGRTLAGSILVAGFRERNVRCSGVAGGVARCMRRVLTVTYLFSLS